MLIAATSDLNLAVSLLTLCCSALACCLTSVSLFRNQAGGKGLGAMICLFFGAALILFSLDLFGQLDAKFFGGIKTILQLTCLAALGIAVWFVGRVSVLWHRKRLSRKSGPVWCMFMGSVLICFLCSTRIQAASRVELTLSSAPSLAGDVKPISDQYGVTDKGRRVELFRFILKGELPQEDEAISITNNTFPAALIRRKEIDLSSNCHGWVFTKGEHLIDSTGVAMILEDNGYTRTNSPASGDVAIYRNGNGKIIHTAVVCSILSDDTILLESKWGVHQRFIHLPEAQPYSTLVEYYRTSRRIHKIEIVDSSTDNSPVIDPDMGG